MVVWHKPSEGIYYRYGEYDDEVQSLTWEGNTSSGAEKVPYTASGDSQPTVNSINDGVNRPVKFHLAYNYDDMYIFYRTVEYSNNTMQFSSEYAVSFGAGCSSHFGPSISVNEEDEVALAWTGIDNSVNKTVSRVNTGSGWSTFFKMGSSVINPVVNYVDGKQGVVAWSQGEKFNNYYWVGFSSEVMPPEVTPLYSSQGDYVQLNDGSSLSGSYVMALRTDLSPRAFNLSNSLTGDNTAKTNEITNYKARQGIITKDSSEIYFLFGDVLVGDSRKDFVPIPEGLANFNSNKLNRYTKTKPFTLTENTNLSFSVMYGIINKDAEDFFKKGKFVKFKVELVEAQTGKVLGAYDDITFEEGSIDNYKNVSYNVSTEGIGNKEVVLQLVEKDNLGGVEHNLAHIQSTDKILNKSSSEDIPYQGTLEIKDYALAQNYPNPFNPTTKINYMIPQAGKVTLKVYDALGREVMTLVDALKEKGRYDAEFNAENLSSGVYIYRLRVNDFVQSRKMLLLK